MGGYLPFSYDITEALKEEKNLLTVKVRDYSETCYYSRGKQKLKNGGMFYTTNTESTFILSNVNIKYAELAVRTLHDVYALDK